MEREVGSGGRRREDSKIGCVCGVGVGGGEGWGGVGWVVCV